MPLYEDLITNYSATVIAGGGSNIGRGAQYILPPDHVLFIGCIGSDHYGGRLTAECSKAGVATAFRIDESMPTGCCGVIITGHHRSLCTNLGAANEYRVEHLQQPHVWELVQGASVYYVEGYHLTVCLDAAIALGEEAVARDKAFLFNFSAAFIPQVFGTAVAQVLPYADYVIGNETEALAWAESQGHGTTDIKGIARHLAKLPKKNQKRNRTVIITQGRNPTVSAVTKEGGDVDVNEHPVRIVASEKIKDTNGAG
jgi:adenosine kinase